VKLPFSINFDKIVFSLVIFFYFKLYFVLLSSFVYISII